MSMLIPRLWRFFLALVLVWGTGATPAQALSAEHQLFSEAWRLVDQAYVDPSFNHQNWWALRQEGLRQPLPDRQATYAAIQKLLNTLDDPFTRFMPPDQYQGLQSATAGELMGVGLQVTRNPETGILEVIAPLHGSPAAAAGIAPRDQILAIDGQPTPNFTLDEAAARLRGPAGSQVVLMIQTGSAPARPVSLTRDHISVNPVSTHLEVGPVPVGYLRLDQFNANAVTELSSSIKAMQAQGVGAYILDLRNNPGGLLQAGIEIARLWLDKGTIVYTVNRQGILGSFLANGTAVTCAPLVVLVNEGTASAGEILAGALQDNHRAQLVGETTYGKGLIQSLFELSDGSGLAITVARYQTPNHRDIHRQGIHPDVEVPSKIADPSLLATAADRQYQVALQLLSAPSQVAGVP